MNDITVVRGDSHSLDLDFDDMPEDGLLNADIIMTVGDLFVKSTDDDITIEDAGLGTATVTIDAGDTDTAPNYRIAYPYDVEVTFPDGSRRTPIRGLFIVLPDQTTH